VQVALYDDRLEVSSPGALFGDLTLEKALAGSTAVRNPRIAKAFEEMELYVSSVDLNLPVSEPLFSKKSKNIFHYEREHADHADSPYA
jgi:hypothetical protein